MVFQGFNTHIQTGAETAFGSGGTANTPIGGKVTNFTPNLGNNIFREQGIGEGRNVTTHLFGDFDENGTMDWEVADFGFLQHAVGPLTGDGSVATPFLLTEADCIAYTASDLQTFVMEVGAEGCDGTDDVDLYTGCIINSFTLTAAVSDILRCSLEWVGKTVLSSTTASAFTPNTVAPYVFQQGSMKFGSVPTAVAFVQNLTLTMNNNNFIFRSIGSRFIEKPEPGLRKYDFAFVVKMDKTHFTTLRDNFYGQVNSPVDGQADAEPTADVEVEAEFSDGGNRSANIRLDQCVIESIGKPVDITGDIVEATFNGYAKLGKSNIPIEWQTIP